MRYQKGVYRSQVHHVDPYIRSGMDSNESDTHDSLKKYPNMQPEDDVVICSTHRSPYGYTAAHAYPVLVMTWKVGRLYSSNILPCLVNPAMDIAVVLMARIGLGLLRT